MIVFNSHHCKLSPQVVYFLHYATASSLSCYHYLLSVLLDLFTFPMPEELIQLVGLLFDAINKIYMSPTLIPYPTNHHVSNNPFYVRDKVRPLMLEFDSIRWPTLTYVHSPEQIFTFHNFIMGAQFLHKIAHCKEWHLYTYSIYVVLLLPI